MSGRGRGSDGQDDVDAAFAAIIADLERDGFGKDGPDRDRAEETTLDLGKNPGLPPHAEPDGEPDRSTNREQDAGGSPGARAERTPGESPEVWRGPTREWDWSAGSDAADSDDEHYEPPEPPPMPRLRAGTIVAIAMLALGALLLVAPALIGIPDRIATPIALVSLATGIGLLVLRMRSGPPPDTGWDDGAQV